MKTYIHYGNDHYDPNMFCMIANDPNFTKPYGGLWASPVDALFSWRDWCCDEKFNLHTLKKHFKFTLKETANVLHIHSKEDLKDLPVIENRYSELGDGRVFLDFEKLLENGIDAIEVYIQADRWNHALSTNYSSHDTLYWKLHPWDCDSILIMNPDIIVPLE